MPTHFKGSTELTLALDTYIKFSRAQGALENRLLHRNTLDGLTLTQFGVLEALYHLGPMCPGELSGKLLKSGGNLTLVVDNLEKQGLVQRTRTADDRRKLTVSLTPAGEELIVRIFPIQAQAIADEMSVLSPEEQRLLGNICRKLGKR